MRIYCIGNEILTWLDIHSDFINIYLATCVGVIFEAGLMSDDQTLTNNLLKELIFWYWDKNQSF